MKVKNGNKFSKWLLDHYKNLQLEVTQLNWINKWVSGFYDFQLSIYIDGKNYIGHGVDKSIDIAFSKAGKNAVSNAICYEHGIGPGAIAISTNYELANLSAKNKLIALDRLFCHYLTKTPFRTLNNYISGINFSKVQQELKKDEIQIQILEMKSLNSIKSIICLSHGKSTGLVLGLGSSKDKSIAMEKALINCLTNTIAFLHGEKINSINKNQWFYARKNIEASDKWIDENSFKYSQLKSKNYYLKNIPLVIVKCENNLLQKSFHGEFNLKKLNLRQIDRFEGNHSNIFELNRLQSPLG